MPRLFCVLFVFFCVLPSALAVPPNGEDWALTGQQIWVGPWATAPRLPAVGDRNGDGRADLVSLWPVNDCVIDLVLTTPFGKPRGSVKEREHFGRAGVAFVCGQFDDSPGDDALAVYADGSVRVFANEKETVAAQLPPGVTLDTSLRGVIADFTGDQQNDVLFMDTQHRAVLLESTRDKSGLPRFRAVVLPFPAPLPRQWAGGNVGGDNRARLFWLAGDGVLYRGVLSLPASAKQVSKFAAPVKVRAGFSPDAHLCMGRFRGTSVADVLIEQTLLPGGDPARAIAVPTLPKADETRDDRLWLVGDFDNNGRDDLLRTRRTGARSWNEDALIHFSYSPKTEPAKGYCCSAPDGLPDAWKLGLIKPGGLDLRALGCRVGRRDLLVELQPLADVPPERIQQMIDGATRYFASLPIANPDGSRGIAFHAIVRESIPTSERDYRTWNDPSDLWRTLWPRYRKPERRGVTHYMGVQNGTAGYSEGEQGWCGAGTLEMLHELGHQLGLSHEGGWQTMFCAANSSIMNYSYSYSRNGRGEDAGYSTGPFAALGALDERNLPEVVPVPFESARFLSGPPYHFHIAPGDDLGTTKVDWNWNGVFEEKGVRADINYSHGVMINPRFDVGYSWGAPALASVRNAKGDERLLLFLAKFPPGTPVPPATADAPIPSVGAKVPGGLVMRVWQGDNVDRDGERWSPETAVQTSGVSGDCSVVSLGAEAWVAFASASGEVMLRRVVVDEAGTPRIGNEQTLPRTNGATPTLAVVGSRIAVLLWRDSRIPVGVCFVTPGKDGTLEVGQEKPLAFTSLTPVGAVAGIIGPDSRASFWVARMHNERRERLPRTELVRFVATGESSLLEVERQTINGLYHPYRPTLFCEPDVNMGQGRISILSGGQNNPDVPWAEQYRTFQTGYPNEDGGWQSRKYYTNDYASRCAPAVCWFKGDLVYALRLFSPDTNRNDVVSLSFHGLGITSETQGDFDDVGHIARAGLTRSISLMN